jgi:CheY-like chemotaxis protein
MPDPQTVLVLEDDPVQRALCERILKTALYEVTGIHDPADLIKNLETLAVPHAILMDIVLPGMDGMTVMQHMQLSPRWCVVPVIMMTSSPTRDRVVAANQLPVPPEAILIKPVEPKLIVQLLRAVIAATEPVHLMRSLQRQRLSLKLLLQASLSELDLISRSHGDSPAECEARHTEARRQIQSLRDAEAQLRDAPAETREVIRQRIQAFEDCCVRYRRQIGWAESRRKLIAMKRSDIFRRQRSIRELEQKIQALALVIDRKGAHRLSPSALAASQQMPSSPEPAPPPPRSTRTV